MNSLVAALVALALAAPGDKLIRTNLGALVPSGDDKVGPTLSFPANVPGAYPSGTTTLTSPPQAMTVTRSSSATYFDANGVLQTAPANNLRVEPNGALTEASATNYVLYSALVVTKWNCTLGACSLSTILSPDGVTYMGGFSPTAPPNHAYQLFGITIPAATAIAYSEWVASASANSTPYLEASCGSSGTNAVTSCTCAAQDGGSCTTNIPATHVCYAQFPGTGSTPRRVWLTYKCTSADTEAYLQVGRTTAGDVEFWGHQLEVEALPTSYIPTTTTAAARSADAVSTANPLTSTNPMSFCVGTTALPYAGRSWSALTTPTLLSTGTDGGVDAWRLRADGSGNLVFDVDQKIGTWSHGYVAGSTHTILAGTTVGMLSLSSDGIAQTLTISGTGDGIVGTQNATLLLGSGSTAGSTWKGYLKNVRLYGVPCSKAR